MSSSNLTKKKQENDDINEILTVLAVLDQWVRIQQYTFFTRVFLDQLISAYSALSEKLQSIQILNQHQDHTAMIEAYKTQTLLWIKTLFSLPINDEEHLATLLLTAHFHEKAMQDALGEYLISRGVEKTLNFLLMLSIDHLSFGKKTHYLDTLTNLLVTQPHLISSGDTHAEDDMDTQKYKNKTIKATLDKALYQQLLNPENTEKKPLSLENLKSCLQSFQDTRLNLTIEQLPNNRFTVTKDKKILRTYVIEDDNGTPMLRESKKGETYTINPALSEKKATLSLYQKAISKLTGRLKRTSRTPYTPSNQHSMRTQSDRTSTTSLTALPTNATASSSPAPVAPDDALNSFHEAPQRSITSRWQNALDALQANTQRGISRQQTLDNLEEASKRVRGEILELSQRPRQPHQNRSTT